MDDQDRQFGMWRNSIMTFKARLRFAASVPHISGGKDVDRPDLSSLVSFRGGAGCA